MMPVLRLFGLTMPVGPLFALLAFYVGSELGARALRGLGDDRDNEASWVHAFGNATFLGLALGLLAARIGYALRYVELYLDQPILLVSLRPGTLALWPGLMVGVSTGVFALYWWSKVPFSKVLDAGAIGGVAAATVWHFGQFLTGDGYGVPGNVPWTVEIWGTARHPVQLYFGLAFLVALFYLWWQRREAAPGQTTWRALLLYSLSELFLYAFRANPATWGPGIRLAQIYALAGLLVAMFVLSYYAGRGGTGKRSREKTVAS